MAIEAGIDFSTFRYEQKVKVSEEVPKVRIYNLRQEDHGESFIRHLQQFVIDAKCDQSHSDLWNGVNGEEMLRRALELGIVREDYGLQLDDFSKSFIPDTKKHGFLEKYDGWDKSCIAEFDWISGPGRFVRMLPEPLHFKLLQSRAEYVFSNEALRKLRNTTIAIAGMGVGSTLSEAFVRLGAKHLRIADRGLVKPHDLKSVSGTTVHSFGNNHAIDIARYLLMINPYLDLAVETKYIGHEDSAETVSLRNFLEGVDVGFEEIDLLGMKGPFRDVMKSQVGVAITVTDTGAGGIISVEYPSDQNFFGRVDESMQRILEDDSVDLPTKTQLAVGAIIGLENVPDHYLEALGRAKNARARYWPQPTMSAYLTAAKATTAVMLHLEGKKVNGEVTTDLYRRLHQ